MPGVVRLLTLVQIWVVCLAVPAIVVVAKMVFVFVVANAREIVVVVLVVVILLGVIIMEPMLIVFDVGVREVS